MDKAVNYQYYKGLPAAQAARPPTMLVHDRPSPAETAIGSGRPMRNHAGAK